MMEKGARRKKKKNKNKKLKAEENRALMLFVIVGRMKVYI
jgi:hypothetical protein